MKTVVSNSAIWRAAACCAVALLALGAGLPRSHAQDAGFPIVSSFSSAEVGADAMSFCARQDASGVLYFGGNTLLTFDGERWISTPIDGAHALFGLDFGADGRLWVAATGKIGWFERSADARWNFHSLLPHLAPEDAPAGEVWHVFAEGAGATFVALDRILRWDGNRFEVWKMPGVRRLPSFRLNGTIYVHYRRAGIYALGRSGPELFLPQALLGEDVGVFWIDAQPTHWLLATSAGVRIYRDGKIEPFAPEVSQFLREEAVTCGARLPDGRYAFGSFRGGIALMRPDGSLDRILREEDGLPTRSISSMLVDRAGSLWVTSPSHIFRVEVSASTVVFDDRAKLPPQVYRTITKAGGRIMVGNEAGVYALSDDQRHFAADALLSGRMPDLRGIGADLFAAGYHGAWRVRAGVVTEIHSTLSDVVAISPSRSRPGELLLADGTEIVRVLPGEPARVVLRGLPDSARSIAEDDTGRLWLGTIARGVFVGPGDAASPAAAAPVPDSFGLPILHGTAHVRGAADGAILVVANNGAWLKPGGAGRFVAVRDFPSRPVAAVSDVGADGTAWVVHAATDSFAATLARITLTGNRARWEPHSAVGLETVGLPRSIFVEPAGAGKTTLWVGGAKGVLRHIVADGPFAPKPRAPLLRTFTRHETTNAPQAITAALPYSSGGIEIEVAEPEFARRAALRLETRIDGIDREWLPLGRDSRRELTAIRDGRYTIRARAVAETGVESEPTVFSFEVLPPWWRTPPALLGAVLALVPVGYGFYRLRIRALRRRNAELEKKVRRRTEELEQASRAKTQFVANISHDIRNPLNGIVGLALALEDTRLDGGQREIVATLRECTTYLSSLVDDVLDFASIEAGKVELRPGPFVPGELLRSIMTTLKSDTVTSGATLVIDVDPNLPPNLQGDAGRIQQILVNYVSNALKYAGGDIRLSVAMPPLSPDEVEFAVTDNGPGISPDEQATLFTKFSRLAGARRADIAGSGLGLASCRLLADLMGGSVGLESSPGHGARFFLRLPLTIASAPADLPSVNLPNTTVLLVEDTDYNAWAAAAVLSRLGLSSERARTGEEALRLFGEKRFNVVLLDRNLPDMDGTEVARRMRQMESDGLQAVLLAVTAYCTAGDRAQCLEAGMDAFIGKPLTPEKLRKVLIAAGRRLLAAGPVHVPPELPPVAPDLSLLDYLSDGSEDSIWTQVQRFVAELDDVESEITLALRERDFASLGTGAHRLLGQARMIGAAALAEAASGLEAAARREAASTAEERFRQSRDEIGALREALRHRQPAAQTA